MKVSEKGSLLRIFVGESDLIDGKPVYEHIVLKANELGLMGATVLKGVMGFGAHHSVHSSKILRLSEDLPAIVEIIDNEENINKLLPYIDEVVKEGMLTIEDVKVIKYRAKD